jgi:hypothetical protein
MSREDMGAYLGLTIESISRLLMKFKKSGWIKLHQRDIELVDRTSLEALAAGMGEDLERAPKAVPAVRPRAKVIPILAAA